MTGRYEAVIGLEVHMELSTRSKIFCACPTAFGAPPNTQCCPVCCGLPGALPVLNRAVVEKAVRFGMAAHCDIAPVSIQERKNYFYPDLPKAYQISQYELPLCRGGYVEIVAGGERARIALERIHIEEDAGKLIHGEQGTLIDFNRCGVPLIEIVTRPELHTAEQAIALLKKLRAIALYTGASEAAMERGQMRCDVNLSLHMPGQPLGTRTEMKNLNSYSAVARAIESECQRQAAVLERGEAILQETRRFDAGSGQTYTMRSKESDSDYRYFPDPDLPPVSVDRAMRERLRREIPRLPDERAAQYTAGYGLSASDAERVTGRRDIADAFESLVARGAQPHAAAVLLGDAHAHDGEVSFSALDAEQGAHICDIMTRGGISHATARALICELARGSFDVDERIAARGLAQISDRAGLEQAVERAISANAAIVSRVRAGKSGAINALVGMVMRESGGRGNARVIREILAQLLTK